MARKMDKNKLIKDVIYDNRRAKKAIRKLNQSGNKPQLQELYDYRERQADDAVRYFKQTLGAWAILIIHRSKYVSISENILVEAHSLKDISGHIRVSVGSIDANNDYERMNCMKKYNLWTAPAKALLFHLAYKKMQKRQAELLSIKRERARAVESVTA